MKHDIVKALQRIDELSSSPFWFSGASRELVKHLNDFGSFRYLEVSYYTIPIELFRVDAAVWEARRNCQPVVDEFDRAANEKILGLQAEIETSNEKPPHKFRIVDGALERILAQKGSRARNALIWQNWQFGSKPRKTHTSHTDDIEGVKAPLWLNPEILDRVLDLVYFPKEKAAYYREAARQRKVLSSTSENA